MPLTNAILLDLDDTIVPFDAVTDDCWRSLCARYAVELAIVEADRLILTILVARSPRFVQSALSRARPDTARRRNPLPGVRCGCVLRVRRGPSPTWLFHRRRRLAFGA